MVGMMIVCSTYYYLSCRKRSPAYPYVRACCSWHVEYDATAPPCMAGYSTPHRLDRTGNKKKQVLNSGAHLPTVPTPTVSNAQKSKSLFDWMTEKIIEG